MPGFTTNTFDKFSKTPPTSNKGLASKTQRILWHYSWFTQESFGLRLD